MEIRVIPPSLFVSVATKRKLVGGGALNAVSLDSLVYKEQAHNLGLAGGGILIAAILAFRLYLLIAVVTPVAYAMQSAGALVVEYLRRHGGELPQGWNDLRDVLTSFIRRRP